jgi:hypothetical protein
MLLTKPQIDALMEYVEEVVALRIKEHCYNEHHDEFADSDDMEQSKIKLRAVLEEL